MDWIFSQSTPAAPDAAEWVRNVIAMVNLAGFGGLVWYLIYKHIPAIEERHREERREWRSFMEKRDNQQVERDAKSVETISQFEKALLGFEHTLDRVLDKLNHNNG